jgi:hypothetical protein
MEEREDKYKINWKIFFICVGIIVIGYVLLYFGSTSIAPFLIVIGYILTGISLLPGKEKNQDVREKEKEK